MRARNKIFHIDCFKCVACSRQLIPGDEFALRDDGLFCKADHEVVERATSTPNGSKSENSDSGVGSPSNNNNNESKPNLHTSGKKSILTNFFISQNIKCWLKRKFPKNFLEGKMMCYHTYPYQIAKMYQHKSFVQLLCFVWECLTNFISVFTYVVYNCSGPFLFEACRSIQTYPPIIPAPSYPSDNRCKLQVTTVYYEAVDVIGLQLQVQNFKA